MEQLLDAAPLWGLVFARVAGVALLVPPMGDRHVPVTLRIAVAAVIAVPLWQTVDGDALTDLPLASYLLWVIRNLVVGLIIGGAVAAVLWGAQMAGGFLEALAGWQPDAVRGGAGGRFLYLLTAAVFVLIDGHHGVLMVLATSFEAVSLGPDSVRAAAEQALVLLPARMLLSTLMIVAPALLAALIALAVLAAAERVSVELSAAGMTGRVAPLVVMAALIAGLPVMAYIALWQVRIAMEHVAALFG